jgi:Sec-independent protein secretion pathway component TatC
VQTCESVFARFQEHVSEASRLTILVGLLFEFELVYAVLAKAGFCCCKLLSIEKCIVISGILLITLIIPSLLLLWKENG